LNIEGLNLKRGRRIFLVLLACALAVVVAALVWPREKEPEHQGKKLSEWIAYRNSGDIGAHEMERHAVRAIGTNALPFLVTWIAYERPAWLGRVPAELRRLLRLDALYAVRKRRADGAVEATRWAPRLLPQFLRW
jgi:hypothetical protein